MKKLWRTSPAVPHGKNVRQEIAADLPEASKRRFRAGLRRNPWEDDPAEMTVAKESLERPRAAVRARLLGSDHVRAGPGSISWKINP